MTTKYETPQYRHGVFFDEVREPAPTGERKQVYLLQKKVVAIGQYRKDNDRFGDFVDGGITMSVRGGRIKDIQKALATDKDYKSLATEEIHKKYPIQYIEKPEEQKSEPEKPKDDWEEYRKQLAKEIFLIYIKSEADSPINSPQVLSEAAADAADALIEELKKDYQ